MQILLTGASGSGVTTLGEALSSELNVPFFDADTYYWEPSEPPFTIRRPAPIRNQMLKADLSQHSAWIVGGSLISWGPEWQSLFDLAVFLWLPPAIRLARLQQREQDRYGDAISTDPVRQMQSEEFLNWAAGYDDGSAHGRTLAAQTAWLAALPCPVLELRGDLSVAERMVRVMQKLPVT
ncbi:AAA family ATPase [Hymenobacter profundi]|uniref:AAA family ATPase n=1 Tax=Hymenobacter profundi TaxID=1982110 RepID=A0ABS6X355_9BACT|nr:AAA family ATPase [Hymenobacter profundi]MBW3130252.1 AAA family ATPase [Hymenobacter profundi]